jgi:hypothetical protein
VAISNHRLVAFDGTSVTFRWKDYAHGNKKRKMTVTAHEFLRRFLLHVLPRGFVRIRHFGLLSTRTRAVLMPLCRQLLADSPLHRPTVSDVPSSAHLWLCPKCAAPMAVLERLTAQQLYLQSFCRTNFADTS